MPAFTWAMKARLRTLERERAQRERRLEEIERRLQASEEQARINSAAYAALDSRLSDSRRGFEPVSSASTASTRKSTESSSGERGWRKGAA